MDVATCGTLLSKTAEETYRLLVEISANNYQWPSERSLAKKAAGIHEVNLIVNLSAQVSALATQITTLTIREALLSKEATMVATTSYIDERVGVEQEEC